VAGWLRRVTQTPFIAGPLALIKLATAMKEKLINICLTFENLGREFDTYPYIPFIPNTWNKILVLGESQQLRGKRKGNSKYVERLTKSSIECQIRRLECLHPNLIGITPWDNGLIKLALLSAFPEIKITETAVSNAVPWHLNKKDNKTSKELIEKSVDFWTKILEIMQPDSIICTGLIANNIISHALSKIQLKDCRKYHFRSASLLFFLSKKAKGFQPSDDLIDIFEHNRNLIYLSRTTSQKLYLYYMHLAREAISNQKS
jgi:hypothetical protein